MTRAHIRYLVPAIMTALVLAGCKQSEKPVTPSKPTAEAGAKTNAGAKADAGATSQPPPASVATRPAVVTEPAAITTRPANPALAKARQEGVRAIWVSRMEFRTAEDIARIMQNAKDAGFNTVVFQVRGNGTVYYPSKIEPWAEHYNFQSPGFDPLAVATREARARGLALQAWVNVMPAWRGTRPPANPEQLYNKHPEWSWYDQRGQRQALSDFYVSLNPCLPEVRAYLVELFREIVANYDIDALHMDYIRFPNEPPAIPAGSGLDYPRDAKTLALYKEATGKAPDDDKAAWDQWRTDKVTQLVAEIRAMMRQARPGCLLAASVGADHNGSNPHFRDDLRWSREGLIDMAFPMNYKRDLRTFQAGMEPWLPLRDQVLVVPGLWTQGGSEVVKQQIQAAVQATGSFCLFSYGSLFDNHSEEASAAATRPAGDAAAAGVPGGATQPAGATTSGRGHSGRHARDGAGTSRPARESNETRRRELIPLIQSLPPGRPNA